MSDIAQVIEAYATFVDDREKDYEEQHKAYLLHQVRMRRIHRDVTVYHKHRKLRMEIYTRACSFRNIDEALFQLPPSRRSIELMEKLKWHITEINRVINRIY